MSLKETGARGVVWTGSLQAASYVVQLGGLLVLARLLAPADFGLVAMASVWVVTASVASDLGMGSVVVQHRELSERQIHGAFWAAALAGLALWAALSALAPFVAAFYGDTAVTPILRLLGATVWLNALASVPLALLRKGLRFKAAGLGQFLGAVAGLGASVPLAAAGMGPWSLAWGQVAGSVVPLIAALRLSGFVPRQVGALVSIRPFLASGTYLAASALARIASFNLDQLIVGKFLGAGSLGVYRMATNLANFTYQRLGAVIQSVAFPMMAGIDPGRLRSAYLYTVRARAAVAWPLVAGLAITADPAVPVVLGSRWAETVTPLRWLCLAGAVIAVTAAIGPLLLVQRRNAFLLRWSLLRLLLVGCAVLVGVRWGVPGVAAAIALQSLFVAPWVQWFAGRSIGVGWIHYARSLADPGRCVLPMVAVAWGVGWACRAQGVPDALSLVLQVGLGAATYLLAVRRFCPDLMDLLTGLFRRGADA